MSTVTQRRAGDAIRVQDVWFSPFAGIGQTVMKYEGNGTSGALKRAAIAGARTQSAPPLPIAVHERIVAGRLRRGRRLPDGMQHAFVDWSVRRSTTGISRFVTRALSRNPAQQLDKTPEKEVIPMTSTPETAAVTATQVSPEVDAEFAPSSEADTDYAEPEAPLVSEDFKRGAREAAAEMRYYFLNENEASMYDVSTTELESFERGAIQTTLLDEQRRVEVYDEQRRIEGAGGEF